MKKNKKSLLNKLLEEIETDNRSAEVKTDVDENSTIPDEATEVKPIDVAESDVIENENDVDVELTEETDVDEEEEDKDPDEEDTDAEEEDEDDADEKDVDLEESADESDEDKKEDEKSDEEEKESKEDESEDKDEKNEEKTDDATEELKESIYKLLEEMEDDDDDSDDEDDSDEDDSDEDDEDDDSDDEEEKLEESVNVKNSKKSLKASIYKLLEELDSAEVKTDVDENNTIPDEATEVEPVDVAVDDVLDNVNDVDVELAEGVVNAIKKWKSNRADKKLTKANRNLVATNTVNNETQKSKIMTDKQKTKATAQHKKAAAKQAKAQEKANVAKTASVESQKKVDAKKENKAEVKRIKTKATDSVTSAIQKSNQRKYPGVEAYKGMKKAVNASVEFEKFGHLLTEEVKVANKWVKINEAQLPLFVKDSRNLVEGTLFVNAKSTKNAVMTYKTKNNGWCVSSINESLAGKSIKGLSDFNTAKAIAQKLSEGNQKAIKLMEEDENRSAEVRTDVADNAMIPDEATEVKPIDVTENDIVENENDVDVELAEDILDGASPEAEEVADVEEKEVIDELEHAENGQEQEDALNTLSSDEEINESINKIFGYLKAKNFLNEEDENRSAEVKTDVDENSTIPDEATEVKPIDVAESDVIENENDVDVELVETVKIKSLREAYNVPTGYYSKASKKLVTAKDKMNSLIESLMLVEAQEQNDYLFEELIKATGMAENILEEINKKYRDEAVMKAGQIKKLVEGRHDADDEDVPDYDDFDDESWPKK